MSLFDVSPLDQGRREAQISEDPEEAGEDCDECDEPEVLWNQKASEHDAERELGDSLGDACRPHPTQAGDCLSDEVGVVSCRG